MQAQRYAQLSHGVTPFVVAGALLIGAAGGYALRATAIQLAPAAATTETGDTTHTVLIPRSVREGEAAPDHSVLIPRSVREDDVVVPTQQLIPRTLREEPERGDGTR